MEKARAKKGDGRRDLDKIYAELVSKGKYRNTPEKEYTGVVYTLKLVRDAYGDECADKITDKIVSKYPKVRELFFDTAKACDRFTKYADGKIIGREKAPIKKIKKKDAPKEPSTYEKNGTDQICSGKVVDSTPVYEKLEALWDDADLSNDIEDLELDSKEKKKTKNASSEDKSLS
jgi:hypothetical protein